MENRPKLELISNIAASEVKARISEKTEEAVSPLDDKDKVSQRDLKFLEEKTELRFNNLKVEFQGDMRELSAKMDGKFENVLTNIDGKFINLKSEMERMFLEQKQELAQERKEDRKWIIGTGVGIVAALAAILALFL